MKRLTGSIALVGFLIRPCAAMPLQVADAVLEISVTDDSGAAIPEVKIAITQPETGLERTALTDDLGRSRTIAISPGNYDVRLERPGFKTAIEKGLSLRVGQVSRISIRLSLAPQAETVTVVALPVLLDVFKTDSSTNITPSQIDSLPVPDRDFQRLAFLTPGVQRERGGNRFIGNGPLIGAAGNASQTTIIVDGVDFTDPMAGLSRVRFTQEAIAEFRVIANRFDTEIGGSSAGAISVITKSGDNQPKGSVFGFLRQKSLRAKSALELQENDYSRHHFGMTLGGPIVKNRTHYFGAFERINENAIANFRPGGTFTSLAEDLPQPLRQSLVYGGADHGINSRQTLKVKFAYERYRQENFRSGGVVDRSSGEGVHRDNWNLAGSHAWAVGEAALNQLWIQAGKRGFELPNNSHNLAEHFSSGSTLQTGANIFGDQKNRGDIFEVRDTFFKRIGSGRWAQNLKFGGAVLHIKDDWNFPLFPHGLMVYLDDTRLNPLFYVGASGVSEDTLTTNLVSGFLQTEFRPGSRVTVNVGVRYDIDTNGNNPDFTSPAMPAARGRDTNNLQPRTGMSWDVAGNGRHVVRLGAGLFTSRLLLSPAHIERMQNGFMGWIIQQRISGAVLGFPALALDPQNPATTGIALPRDALRNGDSYVNPYSRQFTAGYTMTVASTGLYFDFEGIYVKGKRELIIRDLNWKGNAGGGGRVDPLFNQVNAYVNDGRSEYKAFVVSINKVSKGHLFTASWTLAHKKNIGDDPQPSLTDYPSDPADINAEWGRSRADERSRFVASAILQLPWRLTVSPILEYGSGQPWNDRLGYDYNGDGKASDRAPGIPKFSKNGPKYLNVNLRLTHRLPLGSASADIIAEAFNVFNRTNYDVNSVETGQFLSGPTLANPALPYRINPRYGQFTATLPPFEAQVGLRLNF